MIASPGSESTSQDNEAQTENTTPEATPQTSRVLQQRYELLDILGQGGMGTVYLARDLRLNNRPCVVKQLRDDVMAKDEERLKAQQFFEREAGMLSRLQHPSVVSILDYFVESGEYFLVMEYIEGQDLYQIMRERNATPFDEDQVVDWAIEICDVLSYMHAQNPPVIYRDLKPSNVMIDVKGRIKLVDFGIARPYEVDNENTHVISGGYSPPEQYLGKATPKSDIYALGATMFFLLAGKEPEPLKANLPKENDPEISASLNELIGKAMSQNADERFATAEDMREALLNKDYQPAPENTRSRLTEILVGIIFIIVACFVYLGGSTLEPITGIFKEKSPPPPVKTERDGADKKNVLDGALDASNTGNPYQQRHLMLQVMDESQLTDQASMQSIKDKK